MAIRWRKSIKMGPARINLSSRGVGWSVGAKGFRVGHYASGKKKSHAKRTRTSTAQTPSVSYIQSVIIVLRLVYIVMAAVSVYREFPRSAGWAAIFGIILALRFEPLRNLLAYVYPTFARRVLLFWFGWMTFYTTKDTGVLIFAWSFAVVWTAVWAFVGYKQRSTPKPAENSALDLPDADVPKLDT